MIKKIKKSYLDKRNAVSSSPLSDPKSTEHSRTI